MEALKPAAAVGKVVLLVPRWSEAGGDIQGAPFRAILLAGALLEAGYEVVFFDQEHDLDRADRWAETALHLRQAAAALLWMSEMYPYRQSLNLFALAARIKRDAPGVPVVAGGELISICPPSFLDFECRVDFFVRGGGERTCLELLDALRRGADPEGIAGLVGRSRDGRPWAADPERGARLEAAWLEPYRRLDLRPYIQNGGIFGNGEPTLAIGTGRGCVKKCRFCVWSSQPARILQAGPIADLICDLRAAYGVRQFHIGELDFFMSIPRALALARALAERAPECIWFALGSPADLAKLREEEWALLHAGGLRKIEMGTESGSNRLLRLLGKGHTAEQCLELTRGMLRHGIVPMNNFLFGFPGETREDRQQSLRLIHRIWSLSPERNCITFRYFQPTWQTPLGRQAWAATPGAPANLPEYLAHRPGYDDPGRRSMPWLPRADEAQIKLLVNHYLPLAVSKLPIEGAVRRACYRALRARAEERLRRLDFSLAWDRTAYRLLVGLPLAAAYVP